jgi:hypothetical protein
MGGNRYAVEPTAAHLALRSFLCRVIIGMPRSTLRCRAAPISLE